jgi:cytochrome c biogenesis protein CcmG, thiol:disulfide interchange protein DsbE
MSVRKLIAVLAVLAAGGGVLFAASRSDDEQAPKFDLAAAKRELAGAPAPLAALHAQSSQLVDGGAAAFDGRLRELDGHPIVINKWASWCTPCKAEFPAFQQAATARGKQVAFLGLNSSKDPGAASFLAERPLPYPSYTDPDEKIARAYKIPKNFPMTLFIDARGRTHIHAGAYDDADELIADIDRYAGA